MVLAYEVSSVSYYKVQTSTLFFVPMTYFVHPTKFSLLNNLSKVIVKRIETSKLYLKKKLNMKYNKKTSELYMLYNMHLLLREFYLRQNF